MITQFSFFVLLGFVILLFGAFGRKTRKRKGVYFGLLLIYMAIIGLLRAWEAGEANEWIGQKGGVFRSPTEVALLSLAILFGGIVTLVRSLRLK